ncbi:MAG: adenylate kinase family protein [Candidatus Bathyarchaeia archaeon]
MPIRILETYFIGVAFHIRVGGGMSNRVILVVGTPCVGKTSVARLLASKINAFYINLTELALNENLVSGVDKERGSVVVDEVRMQRKISEIIENIGKDVVVDGHYAASVAPEKFVTHVFVLRRDPVELRSFMEKAGFSGRKLWENLAAEILDVCLFEVVKVYGLGKVCELNVTGKSVEDVVQEILDAVSGRIRCRVGVVDWLGKLESEGLLDEYLRI